MTILKIFNLYFNNYNIKKTHLISNNKKLFLFNNF
jgi:hypothetical protein